MISSVLRPAAAVLILAAAACSSGNQCGRPRTVTTAVHLQASAFAPATVSITCNTTVRWVNDLAVAHTITPDNPTQIGAWQPQDIAAQVNAEFSHKFGAPGSYNYHCTIHAGMTGTVTVTTPLGVLGSRRSGWPRRSS